MAFSSGTFTIDTSGTPYVTGTTISSTVVNNVNTEIATGLTTCITKDGTQATTAAIPFASGLTSAGTIVVTDTTASTSGSTGSIETQGGIGAVKDIVTDATLQPLGDTSAGDKAAFGYTATLGAILTGQGSTYDVTLVNDADATVAGVPTGTTNLALIGNLELGHATDTTLARVSAGVVSIEGDNISTLAVANEYTKTQNFNETALTSTSNAVAWDASANQVATHTLTENTTFGAPSNQVAGAFYSLKIVQAAGPFTVAYNAVFLFEGGTAPTMSTGNGDIDIMTFRSDGTNMMMVGLVQDLS